MNKFARLLACGSAAGLALAVAPVEVQAQSYFTVLSNGCQLTGSNDTELDGPLGTRFSRTQENSNCASLEAKIRCLDPNTNLWKTLQTGYLAQSTVSRTCFTTDVAYTDHNGRQSTSGTAYGFRLNDAS